MNFKLTKRRIISWVMGTVIAASAAATAIEFPWNTDPQGDESSSAAVSAYYQKAYDANPQKKAQPTMDAPLSDKEQYYVDFARNAALKSGVPGQVDEFVRIANLKSKKVLEVGAGSGLLQDAVEDYTGLDISPTARRFFHKPFVEASATEMPFPDNSFDGMWTIWVLEHIPNPEKALLEMRRTTKSGGYLLMLPAWDVSSYAAQGYRVRPYGSFDWMGKLTKATLPVTDSAAFHYLQYHQVRALRWGWVNLLGAPSRLHFSRLNPNYEQYWVADSDASTKLSLHEMYLWFTSRGDRCVNCPSPATMALRDPKIDALIIQVNKQ